MSTISLSSVGDPPASTANKSETAVQVMLRVINGESPEIGEILPKYLETQISFDSKEPENFQTIKNETGETKYCMYSEPAWFVGEKDSTKIIDLMVIADSEERARVEFKRKKDEAVEIKETAKRWAEEAIIPKLNDMQNVIAAMGRGDVFDPERLPGAESDIDIMLFVDFSSEDKEATEKFKAQMDTTFVNKDGASFRTLFIPIFETGLGGAKIEDSPLLQKGGSIQVGFDVIPFPDFKRMVEGLNKEILSQLIHKYEARSLTSGEVLLDRSNGELKTTLRTFVDKYGTEVIF